MKLVKMAQEEMLDELKKGSDGSGRYCKLAPECDENGVWRVGSRMKNFVPFTFDKKLPIILPHDSRLTALIMEDAHKFCHGGQDSTLSRFRSEGFWTLKGGCLAKKHFHSPKALEPRTFHLSIGSRHPFYSKPLHLP